MAGAGIARPTSANVLQRFVSERLREQLDVEATGQEVEEKERCEASLRFYMERAWPILEPRRRFVGGWHLDAYADHLTAVYRGEIRNLVINVPPGTTKSLSLVLWFTWVWGPADRPDLRFLFSSYAKALSIRDSLKCRRLIDSAWYQRLWGDRVQLTSDQNQKTKFENTQTGYRVATSVEGTGTGERGDISVIDDPHNVVEIQSEAEIKKVQTWHDQGWYNRVDEGGRRLLVMQRISDHDLAGHVLESGEWEHLCLPMEYQAKPPPMLDGQTVPLNIPCETSIGFRDPREKQGELLCAARYDRSELASILRTQGETSYAGQYGQVPVPGGGVLVKVERLRYENVLPPLEQFVLIGRGWDKAGTEGDGKFTAGVKIGLHRDGTWWVMDVVRGQWSKVNREPQIRSTAESDGVECRIRIEREPGSGGKDSAQDTIKNLAGFDASDVIVSGQGDKATRGTPFARQVEVSNVVVLRGPWTQVYVAELRSWPRGRFTDQGDGTSVIFNDLALQPVVEVGVWGT